MISKYCGGIMIEMVVHPAAWRCGLIANGNNNRRQYILSQQYLVDGTVDDIVKQVK
jgi:hypothetical protein